MNNPICNIPDNHTAPIATQFIKKTEDHHRFFSLSALPAKRESRKKRWGRIMKKTIKTKEEHSQKPQAKVECNYADNYYGDQTCRPCTNLIESKKRTTDS